jgi:chromosome segregation ATPase
MTPLEIILIIIGIIIIITSCFVVDKSNKSNNEFTKRELTEEEIKDIKNKIDGLLLETIEDSISQADEKLNKISNEKIIAVDDFSNQIMEKIKQNHEEVVFLYNMLNEKETEIKDTLKNANHTINKIAEPQKKIIEIQEETNINVTEEKETDQSKQIINKSLAEKKEKDYKQILELFKQGKSVMEISKNLGLGQGEVKLVIDLYKDRDKDK